MKNKLVVLSMLLILLVAILPIALYVNTALATPSGPSLVVDDSINRVNATLGIKSGSQVTAKGVITNIGPTTLTQLLTGVYFIEGTGVAQPADFTFEFSLDCITWFPIHPSEVKVPKPPASPMQVELVIGQWGGETLNPGQSSAMYLRMTLNNDLTPISWVNKFIQSMIVWVYKDANNNRQWDGGPAEPIYSQPPAYAGVKDWDDPIKIDLAIVHSAELDPIPPMFFYTIQGAINAANPGDTIYVYPGTYAESITINKSLTIRGDTGDASPGPGPNAPVLDGSTLGNAIPAVTITQGLSGVIFEGFEIRNYGTSGNTNEDGIVAWNSGTTNIQIRDNYIHDVGYDGILVGNGWGGPQGLHDSWVITRNIIEKFGAYAVDLENAQNTRITNNAISNPKGPYYAIVVLSLANGVNSIDMSNVTVSGNVIKNYTGYAINLMAWAPDAGASATLRKVTVKENTMSGGNFTAILAWKLGPGTVDLRDLTIDSNVIAVANPRANGYAVWLANVGGTNIFNQNDILLSGILGGTFFHAVNIDGSSTGVWQITRNKLDGNNIGASNVGFRLRSSLPATTILNFTCNKVTEFARGIRSDTLPSGAQVIVHYNNIESNSEYGISNDAGGAVIDARYNWWGDASGPYHSTNPGGLGNPVSDNVDFRHWLSKVKVYPLVHDVAVLPPIPSLPLKGDEYKAEVGATVQINVTAQNKGTAFENFTVTLYYNPTIGTKNVIDLAPGASTVLTFYWDTTAVTPHKEYTLTAKASVVAGETSTADNTAWNIYPVRVGYFHRPTIKVEPAIGPSKVLFANETFQVNVTMNNLSEDWQVEGVQFSLRYNTTLIDFVNATEGPFFAQFVVATGQETIFAYALDDDYVMVMVWLSPDENGTYPIWPNGDSVLTTITFRVVPQLLKGTTASCNLTLFDPIVIDHPEDVLVNVESGICEILGTNIADLNYDRKVNIRDLSMVARAFGAYPGHARWDPDIDITGDNKINIRDLSIVARNFGWVADP